MSVVNAASVQSAANAVAVMRAVVAVAGAVNAPKVAQKAALIHAANAAQKVALRAVLNALQPKAVLKAAVKVVAAQNAPAKLAQTCALRASPAAKAVVTAIAVIVQNAQSVALNAPAHPATPPRKNSHSPTRPPWQPLLAVK